MSFYKKLAVVGLFLLAFFFAFFRLKESPYFWFDEGWYYQTSANLALHGIDGIQMSPGNIQHVSTFVTVGYPLIYPMGLWMKIFGVSVMSARSLMALYILAFIAVSFFLAKRKFGSIVAIAALAMLATFPPLYANGKSVLGEVPGLLYLVSFLLCYGLAMANKERRVFWLIIAGAFAGLCIATKPFFILLLPAVFVGAIVGWRRKELSVEDLATGFISALIPIIAWSIVQFRGGDTLSVILTYYANPYHISDITGIILSNLRNLFTDVGTLFLMSLTLVWVVGLYVRRKTKEMVSLEEIIAFTFSILVILAFLRTGGAYRYLFPAQALAIIFFPHSLLATAGFSMKRFKTGLSSYVAWLLVAVISLLSLYQLSFRSWVADGYSSRKSEFWEDYFSKVSSSTTVFFYDTPEVVPFMKGDNYYQFILAPAGSSTGAEQLPILEKAKADLVIVAGTRLEYNIGGIFDRYKVKDKAYKYSILMKR